MALNLAPFGRWTLRDKAAQRRLALRSIGPSSRAELKEVMDSKYSISIRPLDWVGSGQFVTHTAFLTTDSKTLKLRLRFNPLDGYFHVVGFANEQSLGRQT